MKYKAIIFDMDGTIITTESIWDQSSKALLKKHANLTDEECQSVLPLLKGASLDVSCDYIQKTFKTKATTQELILERQQFAFDRFAQGISLIDGFTKFHNSLQNFNLKSAIATNASQKELDEILQHIPLHTFFKGHMYTIDRVFKIAKPNPDIYLYAASQINTQPQHCIAIEDSAHGIAAAKAAGMYCIGINTGKDHNALKKADLIIEHYDEINLHDLM